MYRYASAEKNLKNWKKSKEIINKALGIWND